MQSEDKGFAHRLTKTMAEGRITQEKLAEMVGVSQSSVSRWMRGAMPHLRQTFLLCQALGVDHEWLIFGVEKEPPLEFTDAMRRRLIEARERDGKTLEDIGRFFHAKPDEVETMRLVEMGNAQPSRRALANWIRALSLKEEWLFEGKGPMFQPETAFYVIAPSDIAGVKERERHLRKEAEFLTNQANRLAWEVEQSERDTKERGEFSPTIAQAPRRRR